MSYSGIERIAQDAISANQGETTGDKMIVGFKRPATILGFGLIVAAAYGAETTNMVVALDHDPASGARVEKATITIPDNAPLGAVYEASELQRGRNPVSPNAVMDAFDVAEGDLVIVEVTTANSAGAGEPLFYVLVAPKGSL